MLRRALAVDPHYEDAKRGSVRPFSFAFGDRWLYVAQKWRKRCRVTGLCVAQNWTKQCTCCSNRIVRTSGPNALGQHGLDVRRKGLKKRLGLGAGLGWCSGRRRRCRG
eukprot:1730736-Rhodomonas_salina.1